MFLGISEEKGLIYGSLPSLHSKQVFQPNCFRITSIIIGPCWSLVSLDFITHLITSEGNTTILTVVDRFSKIVRFYPLPKQLSLKERTRQREYNSCYTRFSSCMVSLYMLFQMRPPVYLSVLESFMFLALCFCQSFFKIPPQVQQPNRKTKPRERPLLPCFPDS